MNCDPVSGLLHCFLLQTPEAKPNKQWTQCPPPATAFIDVVHHDVCHFVFCLFSPFEQKEIPLNCFVCFLSSCSTHFKISASFTTAWNKCLFGFFPAFSHLMLSPVFLWPGTPCQINKVLSHPTFPITITAQEDRHIKFFDNNSGKLIHSMVAHLDAVTSLAVDPNGLYLMSGSKYLSLLLGL